MAVYNSKDKLAYFKDNKQTLEAQEEYDMTKYYYNRDGIATATDQQQQMLQQQQQHLHSDSRGNYNPYLTGGGGGPSSYPMHPHPQVQQQQRLPMPQLPGRSQSGGMPGGNDGHYVHVTPQMQRATTSPYGAPAPNQLYPHQLPPNRMTPVDDRINGNAPSQQQVNMNYGMSRSAESNIQYDTNNFPTLSNQQTRHSGMSQQLPSSMNSQIRGEEEFPNLNEEDFPALPGVPSHKLNSSRNEPSDDLNHSHDQLLSNGGGSGGSNRQSSSNTMFYSNAPSGGLHPPSPGLYPTSNSTSNVTPNRPKPLTLSPKLNSSSEGSAPLRPEAKYGMLGLLDVIRLTDRDLNILALGSDLTTYGLNLNSSECLYASFASPFSDHSLSSEPQFNTPSCYLMHPPSLKPEHLAKFLVETLFYMFFAMPKDVFQVSAAQELYRREWRWHAELRIWLKPRSPQEQMQSHPGVQYVYFDPSAWEARLFTSTTRNPLAAGFLSEDEFRGKSLTSSSPALPSSAALSGT